MNRVILLQAIRPWRFDLLQVITSSRLHTATTLDYPRSVPKPNPLGEQSEENKWSQYIQEKTIKNRPLHNEIGTAFGSVRFDQDNKVEYHGQHDDLDKEAEEAEKLFQEGTDDVTGIVSDGQMGSYQERPASAHSASLAAERVEAGDDLFFQDLSNLKPVQFLVIGGSSKSEAISTSSSSKVASSVALNLSSGQTPVTAETSQSHGKLKKERPEPHQEHQRQSEQQPQKHQLEQEHQPRQSGQQHQPRQLQENVSTERNFIDEQYFGGSLPQESESFASKDPVSNLPLAPEAHQIEFSHDQTVETKIKTGPEVDAIDAARNHFMDDQYFSALEQREATPSQSKTAESVFINPSELSDLNYIDSQLIFGDPEARTLSPEVHNEPSSRGSRQDSSGPNNTMEEKQLTKTTKNEKKSHENRTMEGFKKSKKDTKGTALELVRQLRRDSLMTQKSVASSIKTREQEVSEIGQSLQKRVASLAFQRPILPKEIQTISGSAETSREERLNPTGKINPQFCPQDFTKWSSAEMEEVLRKSIVFDAHDIVGLFKPYGVPMFHAPSHSHHSIEKYLPFLSKLLETDQLFQVHRLDLTTSGVLLLAKTPAMHKKLVQLFRERKITKKYWAILNGTPNPSEGIINIPLSEEEIGGRYRVGLRPDHKTGKSRNRSHAKVWPAVTEYTTLAVHGNSSLVEAKPITGFKHQIRAHLGLGLGTPVLGDHKYSYAKELGKPQIVHGDILKKLNVRFSEARHLPIYLHARRVVIPEIVEDKELWVDAKLPHFFNKTLQKLKLSPDVRIK